MSLALALSLLANAQTAINAAGIILEELQKREEAAPAAEDDGGICRHPKDRRKSIATHGRPDAWMCSCGFEGDGNA